MPRALRACATPGCPTLTRRAHCPEHTRRARRTEARQRRAQRDVSMSTYSTTAWRTTRTTYLAHHPHCTHCPAPATQVDHVIPRRILVAAGIHTPDHHQWLQALCISCHSNKTQCVDRLLLKRLEEGEDAQVLANEVMQNRGYAGVGREA